MVVRTPSLTESFAELHRRLGGIPLERIRARPAPGTATEKDLLKPHGPTCELIDGVLVEKPMGTRESLLAMEIAGRIHDHIQPHDLGVILGEAGFIRVGPEQLRAPDVTFIPWSAFPDDELPDDAFWSVSPGLVVEVLSPTNTTPEIDRKLAELFGVGCKLAWVIDPETQTAKVYTSAKRFKELDKAGTLDGGRVLPGFKLPLADLFAATRRRKKKPR
jgi:Uma2 family endonuclease